MKNVSHHAIPDGQAAGALTPATDAAPALSLLVPIYNVERYLRQSLDSACAQTLTDMEIICIDDGSTDGSAAIIEEYAARDARIRVLSKGNTGYGDSMNRGLALARGTYVGVLEPDDIMYPDSMRTLVQAACTVDADVAKGNFDLYWSSPERREFFEVVRLEECARPVCPRDDERIFNQKPSIWSAVYRRAFLEERGIGFLPTPGAAFQDCSFSFKVFAAAQRAVYVHEPLLAYRQDNEGSSVNAKNKVFCTCEEYAEIARWIEGDFASVYGRDDARRLLRVARVAQYDSYMWSYVRLAPEFREMFIERMAHEFSNAFSAGEVSLRDFKPWKRANLQRIVEDPREWVRRYGSFAEKGSLGRLAHYLKVGGPAVVAAYLKERVSHD